jgi:hypothetical protein
VAITETVSGLILTDNFDRANGAPGTDWQILAGTASIASNRLSVGGGASIIRDTGASLSEMVIVGEVMLAPGAASGPMVRIAADSWGWYFQLQENNKIWLFLRNPGYTALVNLGAFVYAANVMIPFKIHVANDFQRSWWGATGATVFTTTYNHMNAKQGTGGFLGNSGLTADNYARCIGNTVVVTGLPAGHKARVGTKVATEVAGTATIDLAEARPPFASVEVLTAADVVVETHSPPLGVWGGGQYAYSSAGAGLVIAATMPALTGALTILPGRSATITAQMAALTAQMSVVAEQFLMCEEPAPVAWDSTCDLNFTIIPGVEARFWARPVAGDDYSAASVWPIDTSGVPYLDTTYPNFNIINPPGSGLTGGGGARVGWQAKLRAHIFPLYNEVYTLWAAHDDGAKIWVDGVLKDEWAISDGTPRVLFNGMMEANRPYLIEVDWWQGPGNAGFILEWQSASQPRQIIPTERTGEGVGLPDPPPPWDECIEPVIEPVWGES